MRVKVYYNLHKHLWSIVDLSINRVVGHSKVLKLENVIPKVSEKGRQRVLREKCKNVHAALIGDLVNIESTIDTKNYRKITYNPYKYNSFVFKDNEEAYKGSNSVLFINQEVYANV